MFSANRQPGQEPAQSAGSGAPNSTGAGANDGSSASPLPQLWMGELDQRWDEITIRQIWAALLGPMGITIHSVKLIRDRQSSQMGLSNAGYCFVRFYNYEDASKVLTMFNGKPIPGSAGRRFFRLNWSSANIQAAAATSTRLPESAAPEFSIFVGDLPQGITEHLLYETFHARYPSCASAKVMIDQNTGRVRGFGFVKFFGNAERQRALTEMQDYVLLGRPIRVSPATHPSQSLRKPHGATAPIPRGPRGANGAGSAGSAGSASSNGATGAIGAPQYAQFAKMPVQQPAPDQYYSDPSNTTVFVGGLNVPITEAQLQELFAKFGDITYVKIPVGKNCGFVQFYHRASAEAAITEMQGYDIGGGCRIRVSWGARAAQRLWFARQLQQPQPQLMVNPADSLGLCGALTDADDLQRVPYAVGMPGGAVSASGASDAEDSAPSQSAREMRLNSLLLAARDGNLDRLDLGSSIYRSSQDGANN
ncbi:DEBR0S4_03378g1_1 [Brettanomyces bruxellensis]|uniref:DEBR0S4_03378g1_1 n=1 Tax=Dekkera bruxellensis TaxID=5007 RepID=A0A7D9H285_DEKBR|nr:DEBR0S4_03378g1_1 [Brettanomyces bruxellensis]